MDDDLKNKIKNAMEVDLKRNGRQPQKEKREDDLKKKWKTTSNK